MKDILTTKITKATKGSDILLINFVLFVSFVVKSAFSFLTAASIALGFLRLNWFRSCCLVPESERRMHAT
jgi:hypothetical protein